MFDIFGWVLFQIYYNVVLKDKIDIFWIKVVRIFKGNIIDGFEIMVILIFNGIVKNIFSLFGINLFRLFLLN